MQYSLVTYIDPSEPKNFESVFVRGCKSSCIKDRFHWDSQASRRKQCCESDSYPSVLGSRFCESDSRLSVGKYYYCLKYLFYFIIIIIGYDNDRVRVINN